MGVAKYLVPGPIRRRYLHIKRRLDALETAVWHLDTAVDALLVSPSYLAGDGVGFNGQLHRKRIFADLVAALRVDAIVETGTWLGDTTAFMAETSGTPVYSCDANPRFHGIARMRLAQVPGVHLFLSDSRTFLRGLGNGPLVEQCVLFYLDAHWYEDLPLPEELDLICSRWKRYVVMIDDFKVPDDQGYGYDDYGGGRALDLGLIADPIAAHGLSAFVPAARSQEETGMRRGCVVLTPESSALSVVKSLRVHPETTLM